MPDVLIKARKNWRGRWIATCLLDTVPGMPGSYTYYDRRTGEYRTAISIKKKASTKETALDLCEHEVRVIREREPRALARRAAEVSEKYGTRRVSV